MKHLALLLLVTPCFAQVPFPSGVGGTDWEGRRGDTVATTKCEAGFVEAVIVLDGLNTTCVPAKQLIDSLIEKLAEAARVIRETRTSLFNMEEKVERLSIVVDILEQENNHLHARVNALTPLKKEKN